MTKQQLHDHREEMARYRLGEAIRDWHNSALSQADHDDAIRRMCEQEAELRDVAACRRQIEAVRP